MASKERKLATPAGTPAAPKAKPVAKSPAKPASDTAVARVATAHRATAKSPATSAPATTKSERKPAQARPKIEPAAPAPAAVTVAAEPVVANPAEPATSTNTPKPPVPGVAVKAPVAVIEKKEPKTMEATIKSATEKTQTLFAEANERAKAAVEKGTKLFEEANEFSKGNIEAIVESGKIAAKGMESFGQDAADYSRKHFEGATAAMKNLATVKSPTDFFKLQSDYVRSAFDSIVAQTSKNTEAMLKLAGEVAQPISNRVAVAVEKVKIAA